MLAWNASSSIVKQNYCKNKTIWLTQTALSKSFYLYHTLAFKTLNNFLKDHFFVQNVFYIKKTFEKCEINDWKNYSKISGVKNAEFKFAN